MKLKLSNSKATNIKVTLKSSDKNKLIAGNDGLLRAMNKGNVKLTVKAGSKKKVYTIKIK